MDKSTAILATQKTQNEIFSLYPSPLITLFQIDLSNILLDLGILTQSQLDFNSLNSNSIFYLHNNVKLISTSIFWQNIEYIALPIQADGFEMSSKGTLPTPKLRMTTSSDGIAAMDIFRQKISQLGDLSGAKVTRIRTFLRFIDQANFPDNAFPDGYSPDMNAELPRDVYYIDRKSQENKYGIEYELASLLDIQDIKLPARLVTANKCIWQYRGEGCCYEFSNRKTSIHGTATLPFQAVPVANVNDELFSDILPNIKLIDRGLYDSTFGYVTGDYVFVTKNGIKYYFVCVSNNPPAGPPNSNFWIADNCSRNTSGCKIRWGNVNGGVLPKGSFDAVNRLTA